MVSASYSITVKVTFARVKCFLPAKSIGKARNAFEAFVGGRDEEVDVCEGERNRSET